MCKLPRRAKALPPPCQVPLAQLPAPTEEESDRDTATLPAMVGDPFYPDITVVGDAVCACVCVCVCAVVYVLCQDGGREAQTRAVHPG